MSECRENCYEVKTLSDLHDLYIRLAFSGEDFEAMFEEGMMLFLSLLSRVTAAYEYALANCDYEPNYPCPRELKRKFDLCHDTLKELYSAFASD